MAAVQVMRLTMTRYMIRDLKPRILIRIKRRKPLQM
jgi:hypothetical protein